MTEYQEPIQGAQNHPRRFFSIVILAVAFVSFWALIIALNLKSVPEKTLYQVLSTEYTYSDTMNFACDRLGNAEEYVDFSGNIYPSSLEAYLTILEDARIAFRILYVNYDREPKYKEYESYVNNLKDFAISTMGHQGTWFNRLYLEACL